MSERYWGVGDCSRNLAGRRKLVGLPGLCPCERILVIRRRGFTVSFAS